MPTLSQASGRPGIVPVHTDLPGRLDLRRRLLQLSRPAPKGPLSRCAPGTAPAANGSCPCAPGWSGRTCFVCTESGVCPAFAGQARSICDTSPFFGESASYKGYQCDLQGFLSKGSSGVAVFCNVRGEKLPSVDGPIGLQVGAQ
jgi:hypothetical protein